MKWPVLFLFFSFFFHTFARYQSKQQMKAYIRMGVVALTLMLTASCKEKKSSTIIITKKKEVKAARPETRKMGDYVQSRKVTWLDNTYTIETRLEADKSLPIVSDGRNKYYDNRVMLRIMRADGTQFFARSFDKSYFKNDVDRSYYKDGALLGIVFVEADGRSLVFAASVGNPDKSSDEYTPLVMKVDNFGNVSVSKDSRLDTSSDTAPEDEGV